MFDLHGPEGSSDGGGEMHVGPSYEEIAESRGDEYGKHQSIQCLHHTQKNIHTHSLSPLTHLG